MPAVRGRRSKGRVMEVATSSAGATTAGLAKAPTGHQGPRRDHRGRPAPRAADAGLRRRRLRQDAARHGVPGARRDPVRRAGRLHVASRRRAADLIGQRRARSGFDLRAPGRPARGSRSTTCTSSGSEIEETGEYDLEGLFIRLGYAIDSIGAKRVVLDTIETLFARPAERGDPARRAAPAVPLAQGQGRHRRSSPASGATARSPATASRNTSPTA